MVCVLAAALRFCGRVKGESGGRCERILQCCEREVPSGAEILHLQEKKVNPAQLQKTILHCVCVAYQKWLNCYFRILEWNIKIIHKKVELLFPHRKQLLRSRTINRTLYAGIPIPILKKIKDVRKINVHFYFLHGIIYHFFLFKS